MPRSHHAMPSIRQDSQPNPRTDHRAYDAALVSAGAQMLLVGVLAACNAPQPTIPEPIVAKTAADPNPAAAATNPLLDMKAAPSAEPTVAVVEERIAAGNYSYLRLKSGEGEYWLATMGAGEQPGTRVQARTYGVHEDFHSRRTGKTFDRLYFGEVELSPAR